jgi:subtilase family serine protease
MPQKARQQLVRDRCAWFEAMEPRTLLSVTDFWAALGQHEGQQQAHQAARHHHHRNPVQVTPNLDVMPLIGAGPAGYSPADVRHAYGFDKLAQDGSGQTIAIVDAYHDPTALADLQTFDAQFGIQAPSAFAQVTQSGGIPSASMQTDSGWGLETSLDVQWAHTIAPGANILLVEANSPSYSDLLAAVDYAKAHASVVSMSWGSGEFRGELNYDSHFAQNNVTFVASSGDTGGVVEWPAASPYVLGVGGTALNLNADGSWKSEAAWSGSGGGGSTFESKPAYQQYVSQGKRKRATPDVAYDADPNTGFSVYDSNYNGSSGWLQVGGTSAGAPQWAALVALADQGRAASQKPALGGTNNVLPAIYNWAHAQFSGGTSYFHDVAAGVGAATGYDLATGNGSPLADQVVGALMNV